jgi:hypothetical protein
MKGKIKIRDIEGDVQQISDLCRNSGFDLNSYLNNKPRKEIISKVWLGILISIFFVLACTVWIGAFNPELTKIAVLALFLILGAVVFIFYHNHENWVTTLIAGLTGLSLILLCLNVYTPKELAKKIEDQSINRLNK